MIALDIADVAIEAIRAIADQKYRDELLAAAEELKRSDAQCRRAKATELILARARLENSLSKLKRKYDEMKLSYGRVAEIESLISEQERKRAVLSFDRKELKRQRPQSIQSKANDFKADSQKVSYFKASRLKAGDFKVGNHKHK